MSGFGDRVRIKDSAETRAAGIAGLEGDVYGFTTPSVTNVEVIGGTLNDSAINVSLAERGSTYWLRPDLVEFVNHNPGMVVGVGNVKAVRQPDGSWSESAATTKGAGFLARLRALFA